MIHPEFFTSLSIRRLDVHSRLLFILSWCVADDFGVLADDAELLRALCFISDHDVTVSDVERMIDDLCAVDCLRRFADENGRRWLHIPAWFRWQHVDRPSKRRNPPPPSECSSSTRRALVEHSSLKEKEKEEEEKEKEEKEGGAGEGRGEGQQELKLDDVISALNRAKRAITR